MAQAPSQVWTPFAVLGAARELAKTADQRRVMSEQGRMFYKLAISEVVALLNASADPTYWTPTVLTVSADQERLADNAINSGIITGYSPSANTLTRSSGVFVSGSIISVSVIDTGSSSRYQFIGRITVGGSTGTYEILSGADGGDYAGYEIFVSVIKSTSTSSADISNIKYDQIVAIQSSTAGFLVPVSPSTFFSLSRANFPNSAYADDCVWTQMGNTIYFQVGSKIQGGVGVVTMYYQRQPDYPSTDADYASTSVFVDLADKWIPLLVKRIYTYCILQTENDIPKNLAQEMALDYQSISNYAGAELQNKMQKDLAKANATR